MTDEVSRWGAVVTGAGSGLGRALVMELASRGARLMVADIDPDAAEETASRARGKGVEAHAFRCDVADREAVFALAQECEGRFGSVDFIANNAGVAVGGVFEQVSQDDWQWIMDINLWGVIYGCQAVVPTMKKQRRGYIVNVASAAGLLSPPRAAPYNVTKAGVVALSETLYAELKPFGVHVTALCPTFFQTGILDAGRGIDEGPMERRARRAMRRSKVQASDVAKATIDSVRAGALYTQPMRDGRMMWRAKRLAPQRFYDTIGRAPKRSR